MGFDLGGLLKTVTDPGSLVNDLAHQFLPKDLQFLGGVAGAFVDFEAGDPLGAVQEGMSALKDLSQNNLSSAKPAGSPGVPAFSWKTEPLPPTFSTPQTPIAEPPRATGPAFEARAGIGHFVGAAPAGAPPAAPETPPGPTLALRGALASSSRPGLTLPSSIAEGFASAPSPSAWRGTPPPPTRPTTPSTSPSDNPPPAVPSSSTPASTPPATGTSGASSSTPASSSQGGQPISEAAKTFLNQGNDALMNAVRNGNIPSAVSDSPAAMMALQSRMNHISEMNQLMTSMMQALHQMQMSIIQNVRV